MAIRKNGYVALFDVLGFSDRVMRGAVEDLDTYVRTVVGIGRYHKRLGTILFSDTVVLFTFDDSEESFHSIIGVSTHLFHDLLMSDVPVRGAISYGKFLRSAHKAHGTVIAGRPIIDAHHYESRSQWVGVMLTPTLLERRPDISHRELSLDSVAKQPLAAVRRIAATVKLMIQPCASIPLTDVAGVPTPFEGFAIVPLTPRAMSLRGLRDTLESVTGKLQRLKQLAPDARSQAKYQRTLDWLKDLHTMFMQVLGEYVEQE